MPAYDPTDYGTDWMVLAEICSHDRISVSVLEDYDHAMVVPDDREVIRIGPDWRPLIGPAVVELHAQLPQYRLSPLCTKAYARNGFFDRERESVLQRAVADTVFNLLRPGIE